MNEYSDEVLFKTINILNDAGIIYWIDGGTLLGIMRDNNLLPWDYDIDFSVWEHENNREEIISLFKNNGYEYMPVMANMDCLQFYINKNKVDISFYTKNSFESSSVWAVPSKILHKKIISAVINVFYLNENKLFGKPGYDVSFFKKMIGSLSYFIPTLILNKLFCYAGTLYDNLGCSYPNKLLNFKEIKYKSGKVSIPIKYEEFLECSYGSDWKTPKQDYDWETEMQNLTTERTDNAEKSIK